MPPEEETQLSARRRLIEESKVDIDYETLQRDRELEGVVEKQIEDGVSQLPSPASSWRMDGSYLPWGLQPSLFSSDRFYIRLLLVTVTCLVVVLVTIIVVGLFL